MDTSSRYGTAKEHLKPPSRGGIGSFGVKGSTPGNIDQVFSVQRPQTSGSGIGGTLEDSFSMG